MPIRRLLQSPRARRALAASAVVLSLGGLVLHRAPAGADPGVFDAQRFGTSFSGPGLSGTFALSHGKALADGRVFAELSLRADEVEVARERAPLSLVVVLDTSGSMSGDKMHEAQQSVLRLLEQMRDDDEIAFVRYDSTAELVQPMARLSEVRASLVSRISEMRSDGGTNIPEGLRLGLSALDGAGAGRVRRLVLVSDGLDSQRDQSESLARAASDRRATVSSLGIGLDFDESYMASVARIGRGNFGFVQDASSLSRFLQRELEQTAATTIERATARIRLPSGLRLVHAVGGEARDLGDGVVEIALGSMFSGDERRVVLELAARGLPGDALRLDGQLSWQRVGGDSAEVAIEALSVLVSADPEAVAASRDPQVHARAVSAFASARQLEAAAAYARGDLAAADRIIAENIAALDGAKAGAAAPLAETIAEQQRSYRDSRDTFRSAEPGSAEGRAAAKAATEKDAANLDRPSY